MKVGTDGTLLGAWAQAPAGECRILDIGTGTGLVALMMAQRYPQSSIIGIDIDSETAVQAQENVAESSFSEKISICRADVREMEDAEGFDAIVCNPPYFVDSLVCSNHQRTTARHTVSLTYGELARSVSRLLKNEGLFSVVIPVESRSSFVAAAILEGFFLSRACMVRTMPHKPAKRCLIEFRKQPVPHVDTSEEVLNTEVNIRSEWYQQLTGDFYLK